MKTFKHTILVLTMVLLANSQGHAADLEPSLLRNLFFVTITPIMATINEFIGEGPLTRDQPFLCHDNFFTAQFKYAQDAYTFIQTNPGQAAKIIAQNTAAIFAAFAITINCIKNKKLDSRDLATLSALTIATTIWMTIIRLAEKPRKTRVAAEWAAITIPYNR